HWFSAYLGQYHRQNGHPRNSCLPLNVSYHQPPFRKLCLRLRGPIHGGLTFEPACKLRQSLLEGHQRLVTEHISNSRDIREAMSDVPDSIAVTDLRGKILAAENLRDAFSDMTNRDGTAAADIKHVSSGGWGFESETASTSDV